MRCRHDFRYMPGYLYCTKCGYRRNRRSRKRRYRKKSSNKRIGIFALIVIIAFVLFINFEPVLQTIRNYISTQEITNQLKSVEESEKIEETIQIEYDLQKPTAPQYPHPLTYMIADIPLEFDKQVIHDGIYDGLNSWAKLNSQFTFRQITLGEPDIMITWIPHNNEHDGLGCMNCIQKGATIELVLAKNDCNGNQIQFGKERLRNIVAHEFGHNIGLGHHINENHLMYSNLDHITPYDDLGYNIPTQGESFMIGEKFYQDRINRLDRQLDPLNHEYDRLDTAYNMLKKNTITEFDYMELNKIVDDINIVADQLNRITDDRNNIIDKINCLNGDYTNFSDIIL